MLVLVVEVGVDAAGAGTDAGADAEVGVDAGVDAGTDAPADGCAEPLALLHFFSLAFKRVRQSNFLLAVSALAAFKAAVTAAAPTW